MTKPLPINEQMRATRRYAAPDSSRFRVWFAQQQRKARKFSWDAGEDPSLLLNFDNARTSYAINELDN